MKSRIFLIIRDLSIEKYIFFVTLIFYILLLVINPSNKIIAFSYVFLFLVYYLKIKKAALSLFFIYISSLIIISGKTYPILLVPPGLFSIDIFPNGYFTNIVVTATHIIAFVMMIYIIRQLVIKKIKFALTLPDFLLISFYILKILSAILISKAPSISIPFELLTLGNFVAYFYARIFIKPNYTIWKKVSYLLAALVIFESLLGFAQLIFRSPLAKSLEYQVNIEYFGQSVGESQFTFRPVGTFEHANALGIWIASVSLFLLANAFKNRSSILWGTFMVGCMLLIVTISRSAWLGFGCGLLFIGIFMSKYSKSFLKQFVSFILKWRFIIAPFFLILFILFVIPRANDSLYAFQEDGGAASFRLIQIQDAIELIKLHPILGIGNAMSVFEGITLNLRTMAASTPLEVHNWYIYIALENGLLTLFVFIFFVLLSLKNLFEAKGDFIIYISVVSAIIALAVSAILQPYIDIWFILLFLSLTNSDNMTLSNAKKISKIFKK